MCGRYTLKTPVADWLAELFPDATLRSQINLSAISAWIPRYNISPSQSILVLCRNDQGEMSIVPMRWGLVPNWTDSIQSSYSMVNARCETLLEKPTFKPLVQKSRCVFLADGYYEWQTEGAKNKLPFWIHSREDHPFGMAGLWTSNKKIQPETELLSATVITVPANEDTRPVHDRMPAMLMDQEEIISWLTRPLPSPEALTHELAPKPPGLFEYFRVSKTVNSARNEGSSLIEPDIVQGDLFS